MDTLLLMLGLMSIAKYSDARDLVRPVKIVSYRVEELDLDTCKMAAHREPGSTVKFKRRVHSNRVVTFTRPIYSDLCEYTTQQKITRIYTYLSDPKDDSVPIIGIMGSNDGGKDLRFPVFSGYVLEGK